MAGNPALALPRLFRKPESQEGPGAPESGREHQSTGKGTGQGAPPPPAGPSPGRGLCAAVRPREQAQAAPRRARGDGRAGDSGSEPPSTRRTETPEEKSWLRARQLMTYYQQGGLQAGRPGCRDPQPRALTSWLSPVPASAPRLAPETTPPPCSRTSMAPLALPSESESGNGTRAQGSPNLPPLPRVCHTSCLGDVGVHTEHPASGGATPLTASDLILAPHLRVQDGKPRAADIHPGFIQDSAQLWAGTQ